MPHSFSFVSTAHSLFLPPAAVALGMVNSDAADKVKSFVTIQFRKQTKKTSVWMSFNMKTLDLF